MPSLSSEYFPRVPVRYLVFMETAVSQLWHQVAIEQACNSDQWKIWCRWCRGQGLAWPNPPRPPHHPLLTPEPLKNRGVGFGLGGSATLASLPALPPTIYGDRINIRVLVLRVARLETNIPVQSFDSA